MKATSRELRAKETPIKSMPRLSAAKAGFILLDFADRLKAVPFKAILNQSFKELKARGSELEARQ